MKRRVILLSFACILFLANSCSTDFNVIAPYKETMVVYGLINPKSTAQYVRISKAFLGDGNSLIMAQQKDSINYADVLDVKIQRIKDGIAYTPFNLTRDVSVPKDSGIFNFPYNVLYKCSNPILADGSSYKLTVHNNQTGLTATSETNIIPDFVPVNVVEPMRFTSNILQSISLNPAAKYGWVYNLIIRFHYKEVTVATHDTVSKYVDWNFEDQAVGAQVPTTVSYSNIYLPDLYRIIGSAVSPKDTNIIKRIIPANTVPGPTADSPIELIYTAGTEELYTFQQLTQPLNGLVQDRPSYTNIQNGLGLFTCRHIISQFHNLKDASRLAFDTSAYTRYIHFIH